MEAFQLLSRGGSFNKSRFNSDFQLFNGTAEKTAPRSQSANELPPSLDFFKYAKKGQSTGLPARRKTLPEASDGDEEQRVGQKRTRSEDEDEKPSLAPALRHRVTTKGERVPAESNTFQDMEERFRLPAHVVKNVLSCGYTEPTAIQRVGVPILAEVILGRDIAAISPTGTGKTLAYLLPLFSRLAAPAVKSTTKSEQGVRALIVAPTRELAAQIYNETLKMAQGRKWRVALFSKASAATLKDAAVRNKVDIIISTPLRLVAAIQGGDLLLSNVQYLVLDEADRLLDAEFVAQIAEIVGVCTNPQCQKAVFSATLPAKAEQTVLAMLREPIRVVVGLKDTPLPHIAQSLVYVAQPESKLPTLIQYLTSPTGYTPPVIVFTSTQARATSLSSELLLAGVKNAEALHAGMTRHEREQCIKRMLQGEVWVLVTTDVLARGMDFGGVHGVINFDWPESVQSYVHRVGRTGRAGRQGAAITYFTDEDAPYLKSIANVLLQSGQPVPEWMTRLQKPSRLKRKQMGKAQHQETSVGRKGENVGRSMAVKKKDMVAGSKRRKTQQAERESGGEE